MFDFFFFLINVYRLKLAVLSDSQYSNTEQVPVSQQLGVEVALLSVKTVEHEKLSPQATGTQECQRG